MTTKIELPTETQSMRYWINDFLLTKQRRWRPKTLRSYRSVLNLYAAYVDNCWPADRQGILRWLDYVKQNGAGEVTIYSYWVRLRSFFNYLEKAGALSSADNPVRQIQNLEVAPELPALSSPVSFPAEDLDRLFQHLDGLSQTNGDGQKAIRDRALLHFAYVTGAREGEIAALSLKQLSLPARKAVILAETSKVKKERTVYFDDVVCHSLEEWLKVRPAYPGVQEVFTSLGGRIPIGSALKPRALYGILQEHCLDAGIERRKFHALRHTSALNALDAGISLDKVQKQLGHANLQTTMNYLRGRDEDRARAYREKSLSVYLKQTGKQKKSE